MDSCAKAIIINKGAKRNMDEKKVMLSGIQPSGDLTLGSYLGAIKNWAELSES